VLEDVTKQRAILCIVRVLGIPTRNTSVCAHVCSVVWRLSVTRLTAGSLARQHMLLAGLCRAVRHFSHPCVSWPLCSCSVRLLAVKVRGYVAAPLPVRWGVQQSCPQGACYSGQSHGFHEQCVALLRC
jgi:hypothetical protein